MAAVLAAPGETVTTTSVEQLAISLDGAYRVVAGQVPHRDFHSALGPLVSLIPGIGYLLSGNLGSAMPLGMALVTFALAPGLAYILVSRLHPILALPFGAFLILVVAAPVNLGEPVTALSFSRYYNRIGWVALATLLTMYLPRLDEERGTVLDAVAASFLLLVMFYTKATYGVVAFVFLAALTFSSQHRLWASGAIVLTAVAAGIVEVFWGSTAAYLADLSLALGASGALRGSWGQITDHVLGNLADYTLLALLAGLALRRTRRWADALFYAFCAGAGFLVINHNTQVWGILTIHAGAAVAAETLIRTPEEGSLWPDRTGWSLRSGAALVFLALILPTLAHSALALGLHAGAAAIRAGAPLSLAGLERVRLADLWSPGEHGEARSYLASVADGITALRDLDTKPGRITVLGPSNPFSAALGAAPARGDSSSLLWGRSADSAHVVPPAKFLGDARIVMVPRAVEPDGKAEHGRPEGKEGLETVYGAYLGARFEFAGQTEHWTIYRARDAGGEAHRPRPALGGNGNPVPSPSSEVP